VLRSASSVYAAVGLHIINCGRAEQLTPGVGLITTAGGSLELMLLPFGLEAPPAGPNRSMSPCWTTFDRPDGWPEA
jgi:hypothetical protein